MSDGAPPRTIRFTVELRHSLRGEHERVERRLGLPARIVDREDYARLLSLWCLVWQHVARSADSATPPGAELTVMATEALTALAMDLGDAEPSHQAAVTSFDLPGDEASLWGAAYVLRGSSLGNQVLHPLILERLGSGAGGLHYLSGHGPDVRRDWSAFCKRLDRWAESATEADRERATRGATHTFRFVGAVADAMAWADEAPAIAAAAMA